MLKDFHKDKRGFSLVELITVITIIAIFAAVLTPTLLHYVERSRAQRDDSAMGELANAVRFAMINQDAYDEILGYLAYGNFSCYIDSPESKSITDPIILREATEKWTDQYMFGDNTRLRDESIYYVAGNMRGITITFEPRMVDGERVMVLADGKINKYLNEKTHEWPNSSEWATDRETWVDAVNYTSVAPDYSMKGTLGTMSQKTYFYHHLWSMFGNYIKLTSHTYRNSEYTIFIRMGTNGGNSGVDQDAMIVYGQWNGTSLPPV